MIQCEKCNTVVDKSHINTGYFTPCSDCKTLLRTDVFPAAVKSMDAGADQQTAILCDDAGCYYHSTKKAVVACTSCGRFLCSLCDIEMDNNHICFFCMEKGWENKTDQNLETHRFLPDGFALRLSIFPLLSVVFAFFTCITAPVAMYMVISNWKAKTSITPRAKRWRFVLAFLFSSLQIAGWIGIIFMVVNK